MTYLLIRRTYAEQHARWLLAFTSIGIGGREKAAWWEYFRLRDLSAVI